jgi:hypothetical protein
LFGRKEDLAFEQPVGDSPRQRHHVRFCAGTNCWRSGRYGSGLRRSTSEWASATRPDRLLTTSARTWTRSGTASSPSSRRRAKLSECSGRTTFTRSCPDGMGWRSVAYRRPARRSAPRAESRADQGADSLTPKVLLLFTRRRFSRM